MGVMELIELVKQFGFPIAVATWFIWQNAKTEKAHKDDLRDVAAKAIHALDASTEAIKDQTTQAASNVTALNDNTAALNQVKGALSTQKRGS